MSTLSARLRRAKFALPSAVTLLSIACGFASIVMSVDNAGIGSAHDYRVAAALLVLAGVFDALDGYVARATGTSSEFGMQLDSIADVMNFGCAPAVLLLLRLRPAGRPCSGAAARGRHRQLLFCRLRRDAAGTLQRQRRPHRPALFRRHADHGRRGLRGVGGGGVARPGSQRGPWRLAGAAAVRRWQFDGVDAALPQLETAEKLARAGAAAG